MAAFGGTGTTTAPVATSCVSIEHALSLGSKSPEVLKLQQFLGVSMTGYFGQMTRQKLIGWQIGHSVIHTAKADGAGTTGPKTRAALRCTQATPISTTTSDAGPSQKVQTVATTTQSITPMPTSSAPIVVPSGGGGSSSGGASPGASPTQYTCTPSGPQPTSQCSPGSWQIIQDEAGCNVWACVDPNDWQG